MLEMPALFRLVTVVLIALACTQASPSRPVGQSVATTPPAAPGGVASPMAVFTMVAPESTPTPDTRLPPTPPRPVPPTVYPTPTAEPIDTPTVLQRAGCFLDPP